jgi:predicted NUDIX family NTP pyrophosphohydrolase
MEWPPGSGRRQRFPEVDRAAWFTVAEARTKLLAGQLPLLERLELERLELERREAGRG